MILAQHLRNSSPWLSDFGRLFDAAFQRASQGPIDLRVNEHDTCWTLEADFPGQSRETLQLDVHDGALRLQIKPNSEVTNTYRLPLGKHIESTAISANLDLGVLTVTLPKATEANETQRIEIN